MIDKTTPPILPLTAPDGAPPRELSLFSGAGGGILGTHLLGAQTAAYVEWTEFPQNVLKARMADGSIPQGVLHNDVQTFDGKSWQGKIEIVSAGFPCFVAGTLIGVREGERSKPVPIELVQVGAEVLTHLGRWRKVTAKMNRDGARIRRLVTGIGYPGDYSSLATTDTTDEHPFYGYGSLDKNQPSFTPAKDLIPHVDCSIYCPNFGGHVQVISNELTDRYETVYNISVEEDESYTANELACHNCQPFSLAGEQKAENDERNMWPATVKIIDDVKPRVAFLENVYGLLGLSHGYFKVILRDMAARGWTMVWDCIPMAAVGAPHHRTRLWMLAIPNPEISEALPWMAYVNDTGRMASPDMSWPTPVATDRSPRQGTENWLGNDLTSKVVDVEYAATGTKPKMSSLNPDWVEWLMGWPIGWSSLQNLPLGKMEEWRTAMANGTWWDKEPNIPRTVQNHRDNALRVKAIGNGQGSLAAAAAFESLWRALPEAVRHAEAHLSDKIEVLDMGCIISLTEDDERRMATQPFATWHPEIQDGLAWLNPKNELRQMTGGKIEVVDNWPRAGLLHKGKVWTRVSDVSDLGRPLAVLGGKRLLHVVDASAAARMFSTPVAYDATPGGPNNHYAGLGHQAKHGDLNASTNDSRKNEIIKRKQFARNRIKMRQGQLTPIEVPLDDFLFSAED